MNCTVLVTAIPCGPALLTDRSRYLRRRSPASVQIRCLSSNSDVSLTGEKLEEDAYTTGGAYDFYDFKGATTSLTYESLSSSKKVTLVRHGLSSWNDESRIQGSTNSSILTDTGAKQAEKCRRALTEIRFDQCFSSPISRAKSTAELIWKEREEPLVFLDSLKEAHLFYLEGMKNGICGELQEMLGGESCLHQEKIF